MDCTRLLCGYARGQITMWDLDSGNCLRVITEAHPVGYAVLHLQFTDDPTVAMMNDSSGSVYTLSFKRMITRTCESACFFSGSKGEVCTMQPLHISPNLKDSPLYGSSLLAMASLTKLIIVNMKPKPVAVFTQKLSGPPICLPILSWYFSLVEAEQEKVIVPVLAFGRNQTILFYKVWKNDDIFSFTVYQTMKVQYILISLHWINSQLVITLDTYERIRIIDVTSKEELECLDLGSVQLVYGSSYFKSLSTGGNVSPALKAASDYVCYQAVHVCNGQLILLGTKSIHCLNVRHWKDRLDFFVRRNEFIEALDLAKLFFEGKGKAVIGLTGTKKIRKSLVGDEIVNILLSYLDVALTVNCPKTNDESILVPYFRSLVPTSIDYCLLINDTELLFNDVYERFSDDHFAKQEFLQGLESYILDGKLTSLTPIVMQDFIENYESNMKLKKLEDCLVRLDLKTVDLDHMVKKCWEYQLYDLIIYIYNKGLSDYLTPLEKLIEILRQLVLEKQGNLDNGDSIIGCKVLVYLSCCLAGNQYPVGNIDENIVKEVKNDIFNWIVTKRSDLIKSNETYPFIRTLLNFDTREFLNVLALAFEDEEFENHIEEVSIGAPQKRQKIIDVLLQVMVDDDSFSPSQIGCLFTFIARQMAKYEVSIKVNHLLFEQVLEYLTNPDESGRHEEREQALLELLAAGGLKQFPDEQILALAESAKFYRVCENIYQAKRQYEKVLSCYWRDPSRKIQAFEYMSNMLQDVSMTDLDKEDLSHAVMNSVIQLVEISAPKFASLIICHFPNNFSDIIKQLECHSVLLYNFLKGVFLKSSIEKLKQDNRINIEPDVQEQFIRLMCDYEPDTVLEYLQGNDHYRLEQTIAIVQPKKLIHATSYLLERIGDITSAFNLLYEDLKLKVKNLNLVYSRSIIEIDEEELADHHKNVRNSLTVVINLCERNSGRLESEDREALWFPLLESVMSPQRKIKVSACSLPKISVEKVLLKENK